MDWTMDNLGRMTLDFGARSVHVGGRGAGNLPVVHQRLGRVAGGPTFDGEAAFADDEFWTAVRPPIKTAEIAAGESMREESGRLWVPDKAGAEHHFYEIADGLEYEIRLPREPAGRIYPIAIFCSPGVRVFHQSALSQAEIDAGDERPQNVVDSWAVYAVRSGDWSRPDRRGIARYETGKLLHLYRPWVDDGRGRRWCEWVVSDGLPAGIRVPPGLVYPAVLGPTFGYTSVGGSSGNAGADYVHAFGPHTAPASGTLTDVYIYLTVLSTTPVTVGVYDDDGGTPPSPNNLLGDSAGASENTDGWVSQALDSGVAITSGNDYWFAHDHDDDTLKIWYDAAVGTDYDWVYDGHPYVGGSLSDPFSETGRVAERNYSGYGDYTTAGGHPAIRRFGGVPFAALNRGVW